MGVEITVIETKFKDQFRNDSDFLSNPGDFSQNLIGSIFEKIHLEQKIDIEWNSKSSQTNLFTLTGGDVIERASGSFFNDGFWIGDDVDIIYIDGIDVTHGPFPETIATISGDGKTITLTAPVAIPDGSYSIMTIHGKNDLTALIYKFGLIENNESTNFLSKVSNNEQSYYISGIGLGAPRSQVPVQGLSSGSYNDWVTGRLFVGFAGNPSTYVQRFFIIHEFRINPWYLDGELSNLQDLILPDLYAGLSTLKYVLNTEFRTTISNPNTSKSSVIDYILGSVGWYNENFNSFDADYELVSIDYENSVSAISKDGLQIGSKTKVTIEINKLSGAMTSGQRVGAYVSFLPNQSEYTDKTTFLMDNFIADSLFCNEGSPTTGTGVIKSCSSSISGGNLILVFETEYTTAQQLKLSSNRRFMISVLIGDKTLINSQSDKVMVFGDVQFYDESADIDGLINFDKFQIFQHNDDIVTGLGYTDATLWPEDGIVIDFDFDLNLNQNAFLNRLDFVLLAFNTVTEEDFELNKFSMPISGAIVSAGVQQLGVSTTRNYILSTGDQFNFVKLSIGPNVGGFQHYTGQFAQKISWQNWIELLDADTVFFDSNKPNDNLNLKASNYSGLFNYEIRMSVKANVTGVSLLGVTGTTNYLFNSPNIKIFDYDLPTDWSGIIETFKASNGAPLDGAILSSEDTLFIITWTKASGPVTDISDFWAIHRIEETQQNGYAIDELSSIRQFPASNRIVPIAPATQLDMSIVSGKVVTTCLIDSNKLTPGIGYNLSGRISDGIPPPAPFNVKLTEAGIPKLTESGDYKIIE